MGEGEGTWTWTSRRGSGRVLVQAVKEEVGELAGRRGRDCSCQQCQWRNAGFEGEEGEGEGVEEGKQQVLQNLVVWLPLHLLPLKKVEVKGLLLLLLHFLQMVVLLLLPLLYL